MQWTDQYPKQNFLQNMNTFYITSDNLRYCTYHDNQSSNKGILDFVIVNVYVKENVSCAAKMVASVTAVK